MMLNYDRMIKRQRKWMLCLLIIMLLGAGFTPYPAIFFGLLLGSIISYYNHWLLQRKVSDFTKEVEKTGKPKSLGVVSRVAAVILGVIIALRFKEYFHLKALIVGFMASYLVILVDIVVIAILNLVGRGEK